MKKVNLFTNGSPSSKRAKELLSREGLEFDEIPINKSKDEWIEPVLMTPEGDFEGLEEIEIYVRYAKYEK